MVCWTTDPEGSPWSGSPPVPTVAMTSASGLLGGHGYFLHWGVIQISLANLVVIVLMLVVFVLALLLPFPHAGADEDAQEDTDVRR
jgi:hypothetical protein